MSCVVHSGKSYGICHFTKLGLKFRAFTNLAKDGEFVGNERSVPVVHGLEYYRHIPGFIVSRILGFPSPPM